MKEHFRKEMNAVDQFSAAFNNTPKRESVDSILAEYPKLIKKKAEDDKDIFTISYFRLDSLASCIVCIGFLFLLVFMTHSIDHRVPKIISFFAIIAAIYALYFALKICFDKIRLVINDDFFFISKGPFQKFSIGYKVLGGFEKEKLNQIYVKRFHGGKKSKTIYNLQAVTNDNEEIILIDDGKREALLIIEKMVETYFGIQNRQLAGEVTDKKIIKFTWKLFFLKFILGFIGLFIPFLIINPSLCSINSIKSIVNFIVRPLQIQYYSLDNDKTKYYFSKTARATNRIKAKEYTLKFDNIKDSYKINVYADKITYIEFDIIDKKLVKKDIKTALLKDFNRGFEEIDCQLIDEQFNQSAQVANWEISENLLENKDGEGVLVVKINDNASKHIKDEIIPNDIEIKKIDFEEKLSRYNSKGLIEEDNNIFHTSFISPGEYKAYTRYTEPYFYGGKIRMFNIQPSKITYLELVERGPKRVFKKLTKTMSIKDAIYAKDNIDYDKLVSLLQEKGKEQKLDESQEKIKANYTFDKSLINSDEWNNAKGFKKAPKGWLLKVIIPNASEDDYVEFTSGLHCLVKNPEVSNKTSGKVQLKNNEFLFINSIQAASIKIKLKNEISFKLDLAKAKKLELLGDLVITPIADDKKGMLVVKIIKEDENE